MKVRVWSMLLARPIVAGSNSVSVIIYTEGLTKNVKRQEEVRLNRLCCEKELGQPARRKPQLRQTDIERLDHF